QQFLQRCFTLDQRQSAQVSSVEIQQVERDEHAVTTTEKQITKDWPAPIIDTGNLAIYDDAFNAEEFGDPCSKIRKATEYVSVPGDQFTMAGFDMRQCPKTVDLQFKDKLVGIKRLGPTWKPYGTHLAWQHGRIIAANAKSEVDRQKP